MNLIRLLFVFATLGAALAIPRLAAAQYSAATNNDFISEVTIRVSPGDRVNSSDRLNGYIGVEKCKDLLDRDEGQVTFVFEKNPRISLQNIDVRALYLLEFDEEDGLDGSCTSDDPQDCRRLEAADYDDLWIQDDQWPVTVRIGFETLLSYRDGEQEPCSFVDSATTSSSLEPQSAHLTDAGHDAQDAAVDDATSDAGSPSDTSGGTAGGYGARDRTYTVRLFFEGRRASYGAEFEDEIADAPLIFDRTRPNRPSDVQAAASDNILRVRFTPLSNTSRIDSYHVFYSTSQLPSDADPSTLADRDGIWREPLGGPRQDTDERTETVRDIDREVGEKLWVAVATRDTADNYSQLRRMNESIEVRESTDFWEKYLGAGGAENGGCACTTSGSLPSGLLFGFFGLTILGLIRHRRRFG